MAITCDAIFSKGIVIDILGNAVIRFLVNRSEDRYHSHLCPLNMKRTVNLDWQKYWK